MARYYNDPLKGKKPEEFYSCHVKDFNIWNKKDTKARLATPEEYEKINLEVCDIEPSQVIFLGENENELFEFEFQHWVTDVFRADTQREEILHVPFGKGKKRITALVEASNADEREYLRGLRVYGTYRAAYNDYKEYGITFL